MSGRISNVTVPDGSVITGEVVVVSFLNEEGQECWNVGIAGDMMQSHVVGLLAMVQHQFLEA